MLEQASALNAPCKWNRLQIHMYGTPSFEFRRLRNCVARVDNKPQHKPEKTILLMIWDSFYNKMSLGTHRSNEINSADRGIIAANIIW